MVLDWLFGKDKTTHKNLPGQSELMLAIADASDVMDGLRAAIAAKKTLRQAMPSVRQIHQANTRILDAFDKLLALDQKEEALVKKVLAQSTTAYQIADTLRSREDLPPEQRLYLVMNLKTGARKAMANEDTLRATVNEAVKLLEEDFQSLTAIRRGLIRTFQTQETAEGNPDYQEEDRLHHDLNTILGKIAHTTLTAAMNAAQVGPLYSPLPISTHRQTIAVMLIHGVTVNPSDFVPMEEEMNKAGFMVWNIRLPGHGMTPEDFFNTPLAEIEGFLRDAFKTFYERVEQYNGKGNGKFYVVGNSMGAMVPLHIAAKDDSQLAGIVSMSACIIPTGLGPLGRIMPRFLGALLSVGQIVLEQKAKSVGHFFYGEPDPISKKAQGMHGFNAEAELLYQQCLIPGEHGPVLDQARLAGLLKDRLRPRLRQYKETVLTKGDLPMYPEAEEDDYLDRIVPIIMTKLIQRVAALDTGAIKDFEVIAQRATIGFHSNKAIAELTSLIKQLFTHDIHHIRVPLFVVQGKHDSVSDPAGAEKLYKSAPAKIKNIKVYPNTGHNPMIDYDKEQVIKDIIGWIIETESHR